MNLALCRLMLCMFGTEFQSDRIAHRYGFDGHESDEMLSFYNRYCLLGTRSTFALNTWYPEIQGGYYVNRRLFVLIDQAIREMGLFPVLSETFRSEGLIPVEEIGHLCEGEEYMLVNVRQKRIGILQILEFSSGSGSQYYRDWCIWDMILPEDLTERLVDKIEIKSQELHIQFSRFPKQFCEPIHKPWWTRLLRF